MPSLRKLRYRHNLFLPLVWPTKRGREQTVERDFGNSASCHISVYRLYFLRYGFQQDNFQYFSLLVFFFSEAVAKAALFVVEEVGAIQMMINPSPVYLRHLRLVCQSRRKSTRLPVAASSKGRLRTLSSSVFFFLGGFYTTTSLRFLLFDCMACNQIFYFLSESVSLPFTSIWMRFSSYRIRWLSPFRRKGNSGMLRCCKVSAFSFGENLHACAPLRFAPGSIFPQKPCIRSSLPLWGHLKRKRPMRQEDALKKCRINERQISSETQLP